MYNPKINFPLVQERFGMYTVGQNVQIACPSSSGGEVEWLEDSVVIANGSGSLDLTLNSLTDSHHLRVYTCREKTMPVVKDSNVTIVVVGKSCS